MAEVAGIDLALGFVPDEVVDGAAGRGSPTRTRSHSTRAATSGSWVKAFRNAFRLRELLRRSRRDRCGVDHHEVRQAEEVSTRTGLPHRINKLKLMIL